MICKVCGCAIFASEHGYVLVNGFDDLERWMNDPYARPMPCLMEHDPFDPEDAAREIIEWLTRT